MKTLLLLALSLGLGAPSQAQLFGPESLTGAAFGGIAGAIIGHNSGRHGGQGAAIGAGAGFLLGSIVGQERRERGYYSDAYYGDYGYGGYGYSSYYPSYYHRRPHVYYPAMTETTVVTSSQPAQQISSPAPAPVRQTAPPVTAMSGANRLFGR